MSVCSFRHYFRKVTPKHLDNPPFMHGPIQRLPAEILSEIFIQCMKPQPPDPSCHYLIARLDRAPLLVSKVCSGWRSIALSTPTLWASFALTIRPKYLKGDVLLAKTWLGRSGKCPLTIGLASEGKFQNNMRPLMRILLLHCERWYDVQLSVSPAVIGSLSEARNRLPRLQRLYIGHKWQTDINIFENAPQLRYVHLAFFIPPSTLKIPWDQLRYCDTGPRDADSCIDLFNLTPNLEECTLSSSGPDPCKPRPPIELPRLRFMTIRGSPAYVLNSLVVPELRELSVHLSVGSWHATQELTSLLSRHSVRILSFHMSYSKHLFDEDMIPILQASHTLVDLELRGCSSQYITRSFLILFSFSKDPETPKSQLLAPLLQTIRVDYAPCRFDVPEFIAAIQSRMVLQTLKTVEIRHSSQDGPPSFDVETVSRLRQLRGGGLDISIIYGGKDLIRAGEIC